MDRERTLRTELGTARADVAALEAQLRRQEAVMSRLRGEVARLERSGQRDDAVPVLRQLEKEEQVQRGLVGRLARLRLRVKVVFEDFIKTTDPGDQFRLLETGQAIALLPVRMETHFQRNREGTDLLVRIYPDDLHVEVHEPELTEEEVQAGKSFWLATIDAEAGPDDERRQVQLAAWRQLAVRFDPERAAWIAHALTPEINGGGPTFREPPLHKDEWTRAPHTRTLPDRWVIQAYADGERIFRVWGGPVPDPLPVGPSPEADIPEPAEGTPAIDPGMRWMFDFEEAESVGMGIRIPLGFGETPHIDLLLALGVKASVTEQESAERMTTLLDGHHYGGGLAFVRQGSPTNNTAAARSAFNQPDSTFERSFDVERGGPLVSPGDGSNGDVTARALGLDPLLFSHVADAQLQEQREARCMNAALWHSTWGYFLNQVMAPTFNRGQILALRNHFVEHVRGRGSLPIIRVGNQPYGLLPVTSLAELTLEESSETPSPILAFTEKLRDLFWRPGTARVPRVGAGGDPDATLLGILGMESASLEIAARPVLGGHYFRNWWLWFRLAGFAEYNQRRDDMARAALDRMDVDWEPRAMNFFHQPFAFELTGPRIQDGLLSVTEPLAPNYITFLRTATPHQVNAESIDGDPPHALLYLLLRHAALMAYGTTAFELLARFDVLARATNLEPELVDFDAERPSVTAINVLDRTVPELTGDMTLAEYLHENHELEHPDLEDYSEFWEALAGLESVDTAALDQLLTETLDLCSHRLDAWISSFAAHALDRLRSGSRPPGLHIGGFGFVENLKPAQARRSEGHVHAPSLQQGMTAAVLRSGYLTHAGTDGGKALAIDLSSTRTRLAMAILDAVRQGQPLGAVLGYRFERGLHEGHPGRELDRYILPLRNLAPLVARKLEQTDEPLESIAAHNVVDGLALHRRWKNDEIPWGEQELPPLGSTDEAAVSAELKTLDDVIDAVSDAVTAEGVFQAIRGNPTRSGSMLDAIARGEAPPPELEVARTARSGIALTHRLLISVSGQAAALGSWPVDTRQARGGAEPRLNAWLAELLGDPDRVRCRVEYLHPETNVVLQVREVRLGVLNLSPLDAMYTINLDETEGSELERRLALHASDPLPAGIPDDAIVSLRFARDPAWSPDILDVSAFGEVIRSLREMVGRGRSLTPADLIVPGENGDGALDAAELQARSDDAVDRYRGILSDLQGMIAPNAAPSPAQLRDRLIRAAHFGVQGAFPLSLIGTDDVAKSTLLTQASSIEGEMRRHSVLIGEMEASFDRTTATPAEQQEHDVARLRHVFGAAFIVLPQFLAANPGELVQAFAASAAVQDGDPREVYRWLKAMTRVRAGAAALGDAFLNLDAISGTDLLRLHVGQLPFQDGDRWIGLPNAPNRVPEANRLSLIAQMAEGFDWSGALAGLVVDEWVETLASSSETTAVTFHFDQPDSRAPNAVLLAVPPHPNRPWDLATLENILLETVELMKVRAVDTEALAQMGQILPALFFASNVQGKTVATDFSRNRAPEPEGGVG